LYAERLFSGKAIATDEKGRIRIDDWMRSDVQEAELWQAATEQRTLAVRRIQWFS
jgi:enoyl-[acyl-carrier protein] reductase/trans-2-enoyl-CoA reductase (NAD+)